jgi:hypothetical protein
MGHAFMPGRTGASGGSWTMGLEGFAPFGIGRAGALASAAHSGCGDGPAQLDASEEKREELPAQAGPSGKRRAA